MQTGSYARARSEPDGSYLCHVKAAALAALDASPPLGGPATSGLALREGQRGTNRGRDTVEIRSSKPRAARQAHAP